MIKLFARFQRMDRIAVGRFNKLFLEQKAAFRAATGEVIAKHASDGILKSGYTIKQCYRAMETHLAAGIADCLLMISNTTDHNGRKRRSLLAELQIIALHFADAMNDQLLDRLKVILGDSGAALTESEKIFTGIKEGCIDQIGKFSDGVTASKDTPWVERHPILTLTVGALIGSVISAVIAKLL